MGRLIANLLWLQDYLLLAQSTFKDLGQKSSDDISFLLPKFPSTATDLHFDESTTWYRLADGMFMHFNTPPRVLGVQCRTLFEKPKRDPLRMSSSTVLSCHADSYPTCRKAHRGDLADPYANARRPWNVLCFQSCQVVSQSTPRSVALRNNRARPTTFMTCRKGVAAGVAPNQPRSTAMHLS